MSNPLPPWATMSQEGIATLDLSLHMYPAEVIFRTAYDFTDRVAVHVDEGGEGTRATVMLLANRADVDLARVIAEFANALVDHRLRRDIGAETRMIRDLIIAQAFVEADLLDDADASADVEIDPRGIARAALQSRP